MTEIGSQIFKHLAPSESLPTTLDRLLKCLNFAPEVTDWWRRSACRLGASLAFAFVKSHHPNVDLEVISRGFPDSILGPDEQANEVKMNDITQAMLPYGRRVAECLDVSDFADDVLTAEDAKATGMLVDTFTEAPFHGAQHNQLRVPYKPPVVAPSAPAAPLPYTANNDEAGGSGGN